MTDGSGWRYEPDLSCPRCGGAPDDTYDWGSYVEANCYTCHLNYVRRKVRTC